MGQTLARLPGPLPPWGTGMIQLSALCRSCRELGRLTFRPSARKRDVPARVRERPRLVTRFLPGLSLEIS